MDPTNNSRLPAGSQFAFPRGLENEHTRTITSLYDALAYTHRVRTSANPAANDDPGVVRSRFNNYRKRLFNAIIILPNDADDTQESQWDVFVHAMHSGQFDLKDIEAKSWIVTEEIIKLHEQGNTLPAKYDKSLKSAADRGMTCSQRMERIINCLLYSKSVCLDMMESDLAMLRFVAVPNAVLKGRKQDKDSNLGMNQTLVVIQANVASAPGPPQMQPSGYPYATLGPQQPGRCGQSGLTKSRFPSSTRCNNALTPPNPLDRVPANKHSGRISSFNDPLRKLDATDSSNPDLPVSSDTGGNTGAIPPASSNATPPRPRKRPRLQDEEAETQTTDLSKEEGPEEQDGQGES